MDNFRKNICRQYSVLRSIKTLGWIEANIFREFHSCFCYCNLTYLVSHDMGTILSSQLTTTSSMCYNFSTDYCGGEGVGLVMEHPVYLNFISFYCIFYMLYRYILYLYFIFCVGF